MRALLRVALASLALPLVACSIDVTDPAFDDEPVTYRPITDDPPPPSTARTEPTTPPARPTPPPAKPSAEVSHPEVVTVLTRDDHGNGWYCTGTLVSATEVITAAHCLDPAPKVRFTIVAEGLAGRPRFSGVSARAWGGPHEVVENPDLGIITLASPVVLPRYAELTDVTSDVATGTVEAAAFVRTDEDIDASFAFTAPMTVSSTVDLGYTYGYGTPMFSKGGDSGAALFLVKNGVPTHELVAVARQPEPSRNLDHFTRVDAAMLAWKAAR